MTDRRILNPNRRDALKLVGVGMAGLAGCSGGTGSDGSGNGDGSGESDETTTEGTTTGTSGGSDLEDEMTIYTTTDYGPVIEEFEKEYDVTVNASVYSGPQTTSRFRTEEEAGNHNASALIGSADGLAWESTKQYLTEVNVSTENKERVLNDAREEQLSEMDAVGYSWPVLALPRGTPYNTSMVDQPPIEWSDFLTSEWEGDLINPPYNMRRVYLALRLQGWEEQRIKDYMVDLDENMQGYPSPAPANVQRIIGGQAAVGVQIMTYFAASPMKDGAPVDVAYPPFTSEHYNAVGVSKNAPSPNMAKEFAEWMTSQAGQKAIQQKMGLLPVAPDLEHGSPTIQERLNEYDPEILPLIPTSEEVSETTEILNEILPITVG